MRRGIFIHLVHVSDEEHEKVVQIILNGEESELVFIEHKSSEALVSIHAVEIT